MNGPHTQQHSGFNYILKFDWILIDVDSMLSLIISKLTTIDIHFVLPSKKGKSYKAHDS